MHPVVGVRFCKDRDGHRIAYAEEGRGPLLVFPAWWVSHLERDADNPEYARFFAALADHFRVVRYDRLGVGLSDCVPRPLSLDAELEHFETLVDHLGADRLHLFGLSCGGPTAVAFAARHPGKVDKMVLFGSYVEGRRVSPDKVQRALVALVRAHWGLGSRTLTDIFYPGADATVQRAFNSVQREGSDAETAARLLELTYALDVSSLVDQVKAPVLVLHRQNHHAIPYAEGRELAARLPGARLLTLEGSIHMPWGGDARAVVDAVVEFAGDGRGRKESGDAGPDAELRRDGEVWTLRFAGRQVLLKDAKGVVDSGAPARAPRAGRPRARDGRRGARPGGHPRRAGARPQGAGWLPDAPGRHRGGPGRGGERATPRQAREGARGAAAPARRRHRAPRALAPAQ